MAQSHPSYSEMFRHQAVWHANHRFGRLFTMDAQTKHRASKNLAAEPGDGNLDLVEKRSVNIENIQLLSASCERHGESA